MVLRTFTIPYPLCYLKVTTIKTIPQNPGKDRRESFPSDVYWDSEVPFLNGRGPLLLYSESGLSSVSSYQTSIDYCSHGYHLAMLCDIRVLQEIHNVLEGSHSWRFWRVLTTICQLFADISTWRVLSLIETVTVDADVHGCCMIKVCWTWSGRSRGNFRRLCLKLEDASII